MRANRTVGRWGGYDSALEPGARAAIIITIGTLAALMLGSCEALFYDHALPPFAGRVERVIELDDIFGGADSYHFRLAAARMVRNGSERDGVTVLGPSVGGRTVAATFDGRSLEQYETAERHYVTQVLTRPDGSLALIDSDAVWHVGPLDGSLAQPGLFAIRPFDAGVPGIDIFEPVEPGEFDPWGFDENDPTTVPLGPPVADTSFVNMMSAAAAPRPVAFDPDSAAGYFEDSLVSLTFEVFLEDGTDVYIVSRFPAELLFALFHEGTALPGNDFLSSVSSVIVERDYTDYRRDDRYQLVFFTRSAVFVATDDGRMVRVPFPDEAGEMVRVGYSDESAVTAEAAIYNAGDYLFEISREGTRINMFAPHRRRLYSVRPFW